MSHEPQHCRNAEIALDKERRLMNEALTRLRERKAKKDG
jgi:hypothetical protein